MKYTVELVALAADDRRNENGFPGLIPKVCLEYPCHNLIPDFSCFWSTEGIMHDIIEHWFEGTLPYFNGKHTGTIWGEIVASGISRYLYNLGFNNFQDRDNQGWGRSVSSDTEIYWMEKDHNIGTPNGLWQEYDFGTCIIPPQRATECWFEREIECYVGDGRIKVPREYRKHIRRAARYGFRLAKRYWGHWDRYDLTYELNKVYNLLRKLVKNFGAEEIAGIYINKLVAHVDTRAACPIKLFAVHERTSVPLEKFIEYGGGLLH